jgi:ATP:ADP antiporter, AAA family
MAKREGETVDSGILSRLLSVFAEVHPEEALSVVLLTLNVFLLLTGYYFLKTVREPLILASGPGAAELKSYASAGQAFTLIFVVRGYGVLVKRLGRMQLSATISIFFALNLVVFYVLGQLKVHLGVPFFIWVGCFSLTVISQFWSFASDCYSPSEGKRLFAIIGVGGSFGSMVGAIIAKQIYKPFGPFNMMLLAAAVLMVCLGLTFVVDRLEKRRAARRGASGEKKEEEPIAKSGPTGGFELILRDRYLLLIAALVMLINWENSTGEYILDRELVAYAESQAGVVGGDTADQIIGVFKGDYFFWANTLGVVLQLLLVSRILKYVDVRGALLIAPIIGLFGYGAIAFLPILGVARITKIAENANDYSLQSTVAKVLFLPLSRAAKYTAQVAIGTVLVRVGDMLSASVVFLGTVLVLSTRAFATINVALVALWFVVAWALGKENRARTAAIEPAAPKADAEPVPS